MYTVMDGDRHNKRIAVWVMWMYREDVQQLASEPIATVTVIARREVSELVPRSSVYSLLSRLTVVPQLTCALSSLSLPPSCAGP
jgi:hypothetical protein